MSSQTRKGPKDHLASTISDLHKSGAYSDLKIICGSDTYNVHKAIICPQSDFFRAACRPDTFQEGRTGVITLHANAGRAIDAMQCPITPDEFDWDLDVENSKTVKAMLHYFYHHEYHTEEPDFVLLSDLVPASLAKGPLAEHAKMYAMGEKYGVPGLKALALRNFEVDFNRTNTGLSTALVIAFMSTPVTDQGLRDLIVQELNVYTSVMGHEEVGKTIERIPDLVYALFRKLLEVNARLSNNLRKI